MRKNPSYALERLHGVPYLLPFGQGNAELRPGVRLDETGLFLWDSLDDAPSQRELAQRLLARMDATSADVRTAEADVACFLGTLRAHGMLLPEPLAAAGTPDLTLAVGPLRLLLFGGAKYWSDMFLPFAETGGAANVPAQSVLVSEETAPAPLGARVLLSGEELTVLESEDFWFLRFPQSACLQLVMLRRDGGEATLYVHSAPAAKSNALREEIFHAVRHVFLYFAARHGCYALHSASILYRERAWLFSAPAGTGKSTQAALWRELFGTPCLNGDLNLLSLSDASGAVLPGRIYVHGLPWCGTSGVATPGCTPLGGVILLRQGQENRIETLREDERQLCAANRLISPAWTQTMLEDNLAFAQALAQSVPVWRYHCTKAPEAAVFLHDVIDRACSGR